MLEGKWQDRMNVTEYKTLVMEMMVGRRCCRRGWGERIAGTKVEWPVRCGSKVACCVGGPRVEDRRARQPAHVPLENKGYGTNRCSQPQGPNEGRRHTRPNTPPQRRRCAPGAPPPGRQSRRGTANPIAKGGWEERHRPSESCHTWPGWFTRTAAHWHPAAGSRVCAAEPGRPVLAVHVAI